MRRIFLALSAAFWIAVAGFAVFDPPPPAPTRAPTPEPPAAAGPRRISAAELARHASPADCWMAIDGQVYALSNYLPRHPSEPGLIEPWCGRDATEAYRTQLRGRAHSARADRLLQQHLLGPLQ